MSLKARAMTAVLMTATLSLMVAGCGSEPEFAPQPGPPDGGPPPPPPPTTTQTVAAPPPPAQPGPCDSVASLSMSTMFQGRAGTEAPGMKPEGGMLCGVVPEGQTLSSPTFMLQQGFCYTFLAQALPTVTEVDLQVELDMSAGNPGLAALNIKPLLAVDADTGAQAAVSAKSSCYQWLFPIPAPVKMVAKARTGSGPVAAQIYMKKK